MIENKVNANLNELVVERRDPKVVFIEPVHVGQCPLCGEDIFSENNADNDPSMAVICCNCEWWENQFLTWEEINGR